MPITLSQQIVFATSGEILHLPGLPPMYDYEHQPQEVRSPLSMPLKQLMVLQMLMKGVAGPFWIEARK